MVLSFLKNLIFLIFAISLSSANKCKYGYQGKNCDECGRTFVSPNVKIIGGVEAVPHSWPSIIALVHKGQQICGGTLIDRDTVLTAAHCFDKDRTVSNFEVYVGMHSIKGLEDGSSVAPGYGIAVKSINIHPNYNIDTNVNDITILKLAEPATLDKNVQLACLPTQTFPQSVNIPAWSVGWGAITDPNQTYPDELQNVKLTLYPFNRCKNVVPAYPKDQRKQLCAGYLPGGKDSCQGDSGGPLYFKQTINKQIRYFVGGVVSFGDGCGKRNSPGVFTRVSYYLDWINKFL